MQTEKQSAAPTLTRRATKSGLPPLRNYVSEAWRYRTFARYWSKADIKARNLETRLGRFWHILNPLLFGLIYFVFVGILSGGGLGSTDRLAFIVGNLFVWTFFHGTITTGVGSVMTGASGVLGLSSIPRIILPLASTLTSGSLFLRSLLAYVPLHIVSGRGLHIEMLLLPLLFVLTGIMAFGISLLMAALNVYFRDVSRFLPHFLRLWLYLSPAIWEYTRLEDSHPLKPLTVFNPMYQTMIAWTQGFGGQLPGGNASMMTATLTLAGWALFFFVAGFVVFTGREDDFVIRN